MEKIKTPISGFLVLLLAVLLFGGGFYLFVQAVRQGRPPYILWGFISLFVSIILFLGMMIVSPNHSRVLTFFGKYVGTV